MVTQFRNYMENLLLWVTDPEAAKRAWRERRTQAIRIALGPQLSADTRGWPANQILHDDVIEALPSDRASLTRRAFYGRAAFHAGARLQKRLRARNFALSVGAFFLVSATAYLLGRNGSSLAWQWGSITAGLCIAVAGGYVFRCSLGLTPAAWRLMVPAGPLLTEDEIQDVKKFGARVLLRVTPPRTPADLVGSYRSWTYDRDGNPVDGQIVPDDLSVSYLRKALVDESMPMAVAGIAILLAGLFVASDSLSWFIAPIAAAGAAAWSFLAIFDLSSIAKAIGVAALCIAVAAGAGHVTQGIREEAARVAAAEKAKEERLAEEKRTAAAKVVGLQKRLTAMQTQISTERDALQERFQRLLADKDQDTAVAEMLRRHPAPYKPLQGIDPVAFEAFIDLDRESWIATGTSPKLDEHYQAERAKVQAGEEYLHYVNEALELKAPASPAQPADSGPVPTVPVAPDPVIRLETPAPSPATKPRTAPTGVPGKVQVMDW